MSHECEGILKIIAGNPQRDKKIKTIGPSVDGEKHLIKIKAVQDFLAA